METSFAYKATLNSFLKPQNKQGCCQSTLKTKQKTVYTALGYTMAPLLFLLLNLQPHNSCARAGVGPTITADITKYFQWLQLLSLQTQ